MTAPVSKRPIGQAGDGAPATQDQSKPTAKNDTDEEDLEKTALQYMEAVMGRKAGRAFMDDEPTEEDESKKVEAELKVAMAFLEDIWQFSPEVRLKMLTYS